MIPNFQNSSNKNKGSSFLSPAHRCGGARATIELNNSPSAEKSGEARKQAGKKEGGLGEGIFARLRFPRRRRGWGGSVFAFPLLRGRQNRKIFFSLIKKNWGERLKKCRENFSVLLAEAKRRRAETLGGIQSAKSSGFCSKKVRILSKRYRQSENIFVGSSLLSRARQQPLFLIGGVYLKKSELILLTGEASGKRMLIN